MKYIIDDMNMKKYNTDTTYDAGYQRGYQVGYEDAKKKFDPLYFEYGDVVENEDGIKYAFVDNDSNGEYYHFVRMGYPASNLFNRCMIGEKVRFARSYLIDHKFVKIGEKAALVYYMDNTFHYNSCCCDKRED